MEYEEKWFVAVTIFLIFFLSNSSVDFAESDHHTLPCYTVKGEIIKSITRKNIIDSYIKLEKSDFEDILPANGLYVYKIIIDAKSINTNKKGTLIILK